MSWFNRKKPERRLTGVRAILNASHRPPFQPGDIHPHTWELIAWFHAGDDAESLQKALITAICRFQGNVLPDAIATGESLARYIGGQLEYYGSVCIAVDVNRHTEGLYARWER